MNENKLYTTKELVVLLGIKTKRPTETCVLLLKNIEKNKNVKILERVGKQYYISESSLKNTFPHFFSEEKVTPHSLKVLTNRIKDLEEQVKQLQKGKTK